MPAHLPAPRTTALGELGEQLADVLNDYVIRTEFEQDELVVRVIPQHVVRVLTYMRDEQSCRFKQLLDIVGVDYPDRADRFEVIYVLLSMHNNMRVRVKVTVPADTPVPSAVAAFPSAGWFEREVWDLLGVPFSGHPDLRRIMTDYGFDGHPLRKDFPLTGYVELRYDEEQARVVYEPVKLTQDFRTFDFLSPWEGARQILPGDEKVKSIG